MSTVFLSITKADCDEISYTLAKNGLMEITIPLDRDNDDVNTFLHDIDVTNLYKIADKQKKCTEAFRKKVKKMIDKCRKDFDLPIDIDLQLRVNTKKLCDGHVDVHGIVFDGKMLLASNLQYFSDDIVGKIVRYAVFVVACDYESKWSRINSVDVSIGKMSTEFEPEREEHYAIPQKEKYRITMSPDEVKGIRSDLEKAFDQFQKVMKKTPIMGISLG